MPPQDCLLISVSCPSNKQALASVDKEPMRAFVQETLRASLEGYFLGAYNKALGFRVDVLIVAGRPSVTVSQNVQEAVF